MSAERTGFSSEQNRMAYILFSLVLYLIGKREITS